MLVLWWLLVAPAAAEPSFVWDAPAGCPEGEDVRARIEQRLGAPFELVGIEVAIEARGDVLVAHVDTRAVTVANGVRQLESASCDELADAVAVVIARLASEQRRVVRAGADVDAEVPAVAAYAPPAARASDRWGSGVRLLALSGVGTVPQVGFGGELGAYVRRAGLFGELALARWTDRPSDLVMGTPAGVDVALDAIAVRGGWASPQRPLRAWLGTELGVMAGQGTALEGSRRGSTRWTAVTGGVNVGWPMRPWARLVGTFEAAVVLTRPRFVLAEGGEIYQPSALSARCAFGLELGWP